MEDCCTFWLFTFVNLEEKQVSETLNKKREKKWQINNKHRTLYIILEYLNLSGVSYAKNKNIHK